MEKVQKYISERYFKANIIDFIMHPDELLPPGIINMGRVHMILLHAKVNETKNIKYCLRALFSLLPVECLEKTLTFYKSFNIPKNSQLFSIIKNIEYAIKAHYCNQQLMQYPECEVHKHYDLFNSFGKLTFTYYERLNYIYNRQLQLDSKSDDGNTDIIV